MGDITLTTNQENSKHNLLEFKHHCLFYKPGKGKTFPAVFAALEVGGQGLVISKKKIIDEMWIKEISDMLPDNTLYCGVELLVRNEQIRQGLMSKHIDWIIVDEAHLLKNPTSEQSKVIHRLTKNVDYVWGLTGTPRCNSDLDIFGIFHALNIQTWGQMNKTRFENDWGVMKLQKFGHGPAFYVFDGIQHSKRNLWEASIYTAADFSDYEEGDLHKDQQGAQIIAFDFIKSQEYKNALKGFISVADSQSTMIKLTALQKAHQSANGFLYLEDKSVYKIPDFVDKKLEWIKTLPCKPTIIVYRFQQDLVNLQEHLAGTTDIQKFKDGKCDILFMQSSQGVGVNLQRATRIIFYTMDYSYVNFDQMVHRAVRIGQTEAVEIYILYYKNSIEQVILEAVNTKIGLAETFYKISNFIKEVENG